MAARPTSLHADLAAAPDSARTLVEDAAHAMGGLDVLINNAGSLFTRTLFQDWDAVLYAQVMSLNVRAVIEGSQAAVPHLEKAKGAIINLGSIAGNNGGAPGSGMYASAKAFVHNLTRHMASDLAKHGNPRQRHRAGRDQDPVPRQDPARTHAGHAEFGSDGASGCAEDCSGALLFLASNAMSGYITGQVLHINGGQYMPA